MLKTWMKQTGIQNVGDFYIGHQLHNPRNVLKLSTKVSMAVSDRFCMVKMVHLCHSAKFHDQTG